MRRVLPGLAALCLAIAPVSASTVIGLSVEDQARLSTHVVLGTVVSQVGVDDPVSGIETAVTLLVKHDFKGVAKRGDTIVFHTRSGQVGGEISTAVGEAVFQTGRPALVFVEEIDGKLYNFGLSSGVWDVREDRRGVVSFTRALQDGLDVAGDMPLEMGPVSFQAMAARVGAAIQQPELDNVFLRDARVGR